MNNDEVKPPAEESKHPLSNIGNSSPFEVGANVFGVYTPRIELFVKDLSTGELRRLVNALVQYPLNEKEFLDNGSSNTLKQTFKLANECIRARTIMEMETLIKLQEQAKNSEQVEEKKETENG